MANPKVRRAPYTAALALLLLSWTSTLHAGWLKPGDAGRLAAAPAALD